MLLRALVNGELKLAPLGYKLYREANNQSTPFDARTPLTLCMHTLLN